MWRIIFCLCHCASFSCRPWGPGCEVILSADFASHADASAGPLTPGEVGTIVSSDGADNTVNVRSSQGMNWWYRRNALRLHDPTAAPTPLETGFDVALARSTGAFVFKDADTQVTFPSGPITLYFQETVPSEAGTRLSWTFTVTGNSSWGALLCPCVRWLQHGVVLMQPALCGSFPQGQFAPTRQHKAWLVRAGMWRPQPLTCATLELALLFLLPTIRACLHH
jgi:hypothetical protein